MINITPRTWYQVSGTRMDSVAPNPPMPGNIGVRAVMDAWGGGAFDSSRDRLMVWGGGHTDYSGNEIYAFDLGSFVWSRIREPVSSANIDSGNPGTFESTGYYANGTGSYDGQQPRSHHTYSSLQYSPVTDRFIAFTQLGAYQGGQLGSPHTFIYNIGANNWTSGLDIISPYSFSMPTAYDTTTSAFWMYGAGTQGYLTKYDPVNNTWTDHGTIFNGSSQIPDTGQSQYITGVVDPITNRMFAMGNGVCVFWPLSGSSQIDAVNISSRVTGTSALWLATAPGLDYDPISRCIVGYTGTSAIYLFDTTTFVTSAVPMPLNTIIPTNSNSNGTFGRFRYSPKSNVYIVVNSTSEDVYLFKLNADTQPIVAVPPLSATFSIPSPQINITHTQVVASLSATYTLAQAQIPGIPEITGYSRRIKF